MAELSSPNVEPETADDNKTAWIEKQNHITSPMKSDVKHRETVIKKIHKHRLVWAPCSHIKGGMYV